MSTQLTISQIIDIAKVSQVLAANDIAKNPLNTQNLDAKLPRKLYMERKAVEWMYGQNPIYSTLRFTANYLYSLCGKYAATAQALISGGGGTSGGTVVNPSAPVFIEVTAAEFTTATAYDNPLLVGKNIAIFYNNINRYIYSPSEWVYTSTGFEITIPGFDAQGMNSDAVFFVYINN